jgi:hypothetical protein
MCDNPWRRTLAAAAASEASEGIAGFFVQAIYWKWVVAISKTYSDFLFSVDVIEAFG